VQARTLTRLDMLWGKERYRRGESGEERVSKEAATVSEPSFQSQVTVIQFKKLAHINIDKTEPSHKFYSFA